jgi:hypothetical protein
MANKPKPTDKKTLAAFEKEYSIVLNHNYGETREITRATFEKSRDEQGFTSINYDGRVEWLKANNYDVTRENLIDATLPDNPTVQ